MGIDPSRHVGMAEALALGPKEVISLVGAGGKTTLMFALARELAAASPGRVSDHPKQAGLAGSPRNRRFRGVPLVVTTTTTRIQAPAPTQTEALLVAEDEEALLEAVAGAAAAYRLVTLALVREPSGKLRGLGPALVDRLAALAAVSYVIVEADGAAGRPIKAPKAGEPVIPSRCTRLVAVVGVDALGAPLTEEHVFRAAIAAELLGLPLGTPLGAEAIAELILHPAGIAKGAPPGALLIAFLNKVDLEGGLARGEAIAAALLRRRDPRLARVVLGRAREANPVAAVLTAPP